VSSSDDKLPVIGGGDMFEQDREQLRARVERLERECEELEKDLAEVEVELGTARSGRDARVTAAASKRVTRRIAWTVVPVVLLLAGGLVTHLILTFINEETFRGRVVAVEGPAPATEGQECTIELQSFFFPFNALSQVDCGGRRLYGYDNFGSVQCESVDHVATTCTDGGPIGQDGDPGFHFNRRSRRLVLDDGSRWSIVIELDLPGGAG